MSGSEVKWPHSSRACLRTILDGPLGLEPKSCAFKLGVTLRLRSACQSADRPRDTGVSNAAVTPPTDVAQAMALTPVDGRLALLSVCGEK